MSRTAKITRATSESSVELWLDLDGSGAADVSTGVPFYDHMLTSLAKHSLLIQGALRSPQGVSKDRGPACRPSMRLGLVVRDASLRDAPHHEGWRSRMKKLPRVEQ